MFYWLNIIVTFVQLYVFVMSVRCMYILLLLESLVQESILQFMFSSLFDEDTERRKLMYYLPFAACGL
jgi:hypothetical protein